MLVFISGSVNAGKSTTSKLVAEKLGAEWIDIDELADSIPNFSLKTDISKALSLAVKKINIYSQQDKNVVTNYVLRKKDHDIFRNNCIDVEQYYFTLAPRLEVARSDRGRGMNDWEYERIKYHYDTGIASPEFGEIIDNSDITIEQTADVIIKRINELSDD